MYPAADDARPGCWVELTVWGVSGRHVPAALGRMGADRLWLRRVPGLRFAKSLGTGSGDSFALRDADPRHWALLTVWDSEQEAVRFRAGRVHRGWNRLATESLTVGMTPLWARGRWAGQEPFTPGPPAGRGPVAVVTRARLRLARMRGFWRAVPPVAAELRGNPGLLMAMSMGESPLALMGTFSLWESQAAMSAFAHRSPAHIEAVRQTGPQRWYAEELFARFAVRSAQGTYRGQAIHLGRP